MSLLYHKYLFAVYVVTVCFLSFSDLVVPCIKIGQTDGILFLGTTLERKLRYIY